MATILRYLSIYFKIALFFFFFITQLACKEKASFLSCDNLKVAANSQKVKEYLTDWTLKNILEKEILRKDTFVGGGMVPGRLYQVEFDWVLLGFHPGSQVRIVSVFSRDIHELGSIQSVFFGERSRHGILIRNPKSSSFGVDETYLTKITDEVAVICEPRD